MVRWLRHGFPLRFEHEVVASRGMRPLTCVSPAYLKINYQDTVRKVALDDMVQQLLDKRCVRDDGGRGDRFVFQGVSGAKTLGRMASSDKSFSVKRLSSAANVECGLRHWICQMPITTSR